MKLLLVGTMCDGSRGVLNQRSTNSKENRKELEECARRWAALDIAYDLQIIEEK